MNNFLSLIAQNASVMPLDNFRREKYTRALSFGLFAPLASEMLKEDGVVLHPLFCNMQNFRYEIGTEYGVSALLCVALLAQDLLPAAFRNLDIGYLASESNIAEEEIEFLNRYAESDDTSLAILLGRDLYLHAQSEFIAHLLGFIAKKRKVVFYMQDLSKEFSANTLPSELLLDFNALYSLPENNGAFVYLSTDIFEADKLYAPRSFSMIYKIQDNNKINLCLEDAKDTKLKIIFKENLKGTIALFGTPQLLGYPYKKILSLTKLT
ncbi:hypothetical protein ACRE1S_03085 [Helicobacter himalayensis]|uniref:hypothetical protein n=1 Tax=Helicobacter himalayensis TaxID=1591088 RepID=UPI003D6EEC10